MAQREKGLDTIKLSTNFLESDFMTLMEGEFGIIGSWVVLKLVCQIFKNGYYCQWNEDECFRLAKQACGEANSGVIQKIVERMAKRKFFNEEMLSKYNILTSKAIQKEFFCAVRRRQQVTVDEKYLLVDAAKYDNIVVLGKSIVNTEDENLDNDLFGAEEETASKEIVKTPDMEVMDVKKKPTVEVSKTPDTKLTNEVSFEQDKEKQLENKLIHDNSWQEIMMMKTKLNKNELLGKIKEFLIECSCRDNGHKSLKDMKNHFCSWFAKVQEIEKSRNERKQYYSNAYGNHYKRQNDPSGRYETKARSAADYADHF